MTRICPGQREEVDERKGKEGVLAPVRAENAGDLAPLDIDGSARDENAGGPVLAGGDAEDHQVRKRNPQEAVLLHPDDEDARLHHPDEDVPLHQPDGDPDLVDLNPKKTNL